uniref:Uncharacterized protein n=1 Tax=Timema genevievae TaxID=629358 RepID=A0A7R9PM48_TIMGE|nr:unnamed protein product [Timema genevievae]
MNTFERTKKHNTKGDRTYSTVLEAYKATRKFTIRPYTDWEAQPKIKLASACQPLVTELMDGLVCMPILLPRAVTGATRDDYRL